VASAGNAGEPHGHIVQFNYKTFLRDSKEFNNLVNDPECKSVLADMRNLLTTRYLIN